jgi:hypothetical protein
VTVPWLRWLPICLRTQLQVAKSSLWALNCLVVSTSCNQDDVWSAVEFARCSLRLHARSASVVESALALLLNTPKVGWEYWWLLIRPRAVASACPSNHSSAVIAGQQTWWGGGGVPGGGDHPGMGAQLVGRTNLRKAAAAMIDSPYHTRLR